MHNFGHKEQLSAVVLFIEMNRTDDSAPFSLMTNFPKKIFTEDDYDTPLDVLGTLWIWLNCFDREMCIVSISFLLLISFEGKKVHLAE